MEQNERKKMLYEMDASRARWDTDQCAKKMHNITFGCISVCVRCTRVYAGKYVYEHIRSSANQTQ